MKTLSAKLLVPLAFVALSSAAQANELVTNGDFSSGAAGWTISAAYPGSLDISGGNAIFQSAAGIDDELSQSINTKSGHTYRFTFDLKSILSLTNDFSANFGGTQVFSESDGNHDWITYSWTGTATGSKTLLAFFGQNLGSQTYLDNVSVKDISAVPLPASGYLMLSALGVVGFLAMRRGGKSTGSMNFA